MAIQEILGNTGKAEPVKGNRSDSSQKAKGAEREDDGAEKSDHVEVSDEARAMYDADRVRRFEAIRLKIRQGFYFQRDITEKVVDGVIKDLTKTS